MKPIQIRKPDNMLAQKISIGVTGFSRSGKTIFITSIAQALDTFDEWTGKTPLGPLAGFTPYDLGELEGVLINDRVPSGDPRFPFEKLRDSLCRVSPEWPDRTESVSRLSIDISIKTKQPFFFPKKNRGPLKSLGFGTKRIEFIDYPGEWLIDFPMLELEFPEWSNHLITTASKRPRQALSQDFLSLLASSKAPNTFDQALAEHLTNAWRAYLQNAAEQGLTLNQPGRLLRPDKLANSPTINLTPLPQEWAESAFYEGMQKRFEEYKKTVVRPFYKNYFAKIDRQIVLVDLLEAVKQGEFVFEEMKEALGSILKSFSCGQGTFIDRLLGNRISHVLFAATKADHVTSGDRLNLERLLKNVLKMAPGAHPIKFKAKAVDYIALASMCATEDFEKETKPCRDVLRGRAKGDSQVAIWDPGGLPLDFPIKWKTVRFDFLGFEPMPQPNSLLEGFQNINLGHALDFLLS